MGSNESYLPLSLPWLSGSYHPRFASLDKTNDGALSKAELAAGLAASGIHRDHIDEVTSRPLAAASASTASGPPFTCGRE